MASSLTWIIEGRILKVTHTGNLTVDDSIGIHIQIYGHLVNAVRPVHILADLTGLESIQSIVSSIRSQRLNQNRYVLQVFTHRYLGWTAHYPHHPEMVKLLQARGQTSPVPFKHRFFENQLDALTFLQKLDTHTLAKNRNLTIPRSYLMEKV